MSEPNGPTLRALRHHGPMTERDMDFYKAGMSRGKHQALERAGELIVWVAMCALVTFGLTIIMVVAMT